MVARVFGFQCSFPNVFNQDLFRGGAGRRRGNEPQTETGTSILAARLKPESHGGGWLGGGSGCPNRRTHISVPCPIAPTSSKYSRERIKRAPVRYSPEQSGRPPGHAGRRILAIVCRRPSQVVLRTAFCCQRTGGDLPSYLLNHHQAFGGGNC